MIANQDIVWGLVLGSYICIYLLFQDGYICTHINTTNDKYNLLPSQCLCMCSRNDFFSVKVCVDTWCTSVTCNSTGCSACMCSTAGRCSCTVMRNKNMVSCAAAAHPACRIIRISFHSAIAHVSCVLCLLAACLIAVGHLF